MRVAALYDIHGNLPALEAVLAEIADLAPDLAPDLVVVGGDVASGPLPGETLARLRSLQLPVRFLRGNADRELVERYDALAAEDTGSDSAPSDDAGRWAARRISREQRDFLASLPAAVTVDVDGLGPVLFCHGSPRSEDEIVTRATPDERLRAILAGVEPRVVVGGHTHVQFDRAIDEWRVINAGSVGMPYQGAPGAYWLLLGPTVTFQRTEYDLARAAEMIRATGYPDAEQFITGNLLHPPSAEEATEFFERMVVERDTAP